MKFSMLAIAAALMAPAMMAQAQETREFATYKVEFNIRDSGDAGGKTERKLSLLLNAGHKGVFKEGNRVPTATGPLTTSQFSYVDVGLNIEATVQDLGSKYELRADLDVSTSVAAEKGAAIQNPTISQIRVAIEMSLPPGKPAVVAAFDDPVTGRKFEIEATISKI
jgi:hypothetical protein